MLYIYILIGLILVIVLYLVIKLIQGSAPEGFAKGIAEAQIYSYKKFRNKFPDMTKENLFHEVLKSRPGYSDEDISNIMDISRNQKGIVHFPRFVYALVLREYESRTGLKPDTLTSAELYGGVEAAFKKSFKGL